MRNQLNHLMRVLPEEEMLLSDLLDPQPDFPMQLAAGGISFQTQRAINELDREGRPVQQPVGPGAGTTGRDDRMTEDWRKRQAPKQEGLLQDLLRRRRELEMQLRGRG